MEGKGASKEDVSMEAALKEAASPFRKAAHHGLVVGHWGFGDDLDLSFSAL
jgi:hypothetical protein